MATGTMSVYPDETGNASANPTAATVDASTPSPDPMRSQNGQVDIRSVSRIGGVQPTVAEVGVRRSERQRATASPSVLMWPRRAR